MDNAQLTKVVAALARAMNAGATMRIARNSGFCQRMRSVTPQELAIAVIAAMATHSTETDTPLRVVLHWNAQRKDYMVLVTNLDRVLFPPAHIYQLYRLRWQIELLFKEWKSSCNLHSFATSKAPIVEGFMWAALSACIIKRFMAKAAQKVFDVGEISTRKLR